MRNHEVTNVQLLLDEKGELREPGWSRSLVQKYRRDDIKAPAFRIKEWDYYLVVNKDFAAAFTISDDGYIGLQSVSLLVFGEEPWEHTETVLNAFPMGKLKLPEDPDMTWLERLRHAGVDVTTGMGYCQDDEEFYRSLLLQFASEAAVKRADMEKFYTVKDYKNYEILVHALKSTSMMIGCTSLSEQARSLEFAAKENRIDYIIDHHAEVMTQYDQLTSVIYAAADPEQSNAVLEFMPEESAGSADDEILIFAPEGE